MRASKALFLVLAWWMLAACEREGTQELPDAGEERFERIPVRALDAWPRDLRYLPMAHVYADTKRIRVTVEVGADYDKACVYVLEDVDLAKLAPAIVRALPRSHTTRSVAVHVSDDVKLSRIEEVLRAAAESRVTLYFATSFRPPDKLSAPDCVPSVAMFDGQNMADPFQRDWAIFGACSMRCLSTKEFEDEPCRQRCVAMETARETR